MVAAFKRFIIMGVWLLLVSSRLYSQEPDQIIILPDSSLKFPPEREKTFDISKVFSLPLYFKYGLNSFPEVHRDETVRLSVFSPFPLSKGQGLYIETMWKSKLQDEKKYRTLWMVLGSVEMGGALYVAYRHIKKYGFW
jgi:hypothetical protein